MAEFRLTRPGQVDLTFEGEQIAHASSKLTRRPRWTEVDIYRTTAGKWVTDVIGRSTMPGEHDRFKVTICTTPQEVRESLKVYDAAYLTDIAIEALERAADNDPELQDAAEERLA